MENQFKCLNRSLSYTLECRKIDEMDRDEVLQRSKKWLNAWKLESHSVHKGIEMHHQFGITQMESILDGAPLENIKKFAKDFYKLYLMSQEIKDHWGEEFAT